MSYTRDDLVEYVQNEYRELLAEAELSDQDAKDGIKGPVDKALRRLGVLDETTYFDEDQGEALADYFVLQKLTRLTSKLVSISRTSPGGSVTKDRSAFFRQLKEMYIDARVRLKELGLTGIAEAAVYEFDMQLYARHTQPI